LLRVMIACIQADPGKLEAELPNGLIMGHAYSITGVKLVTSLTILSVDWILLMNYTSHNPEWLSVQVSVYLISNLYTVISDDWLGSV